MGKKCLSLVVLVLSSRKWAAFVKQDFFKLLGQKSETVFGRINGVIG